MATLCQVYLCHFSNSICSLCVSMSHFVTIISQYFQLFHYYYICYGDLWSVIFDGTIVIVLGSHELCLYKMVNLTDKCMFWLLHQLPIFPSLSLSEGLPVPWDTKLSKLGQLMTIQWPLDVHVKERITCLSFKSKARND